MSCPDPNRSGWSCVDLHFQSRPESAPLALIYLTNWCAKTLVSLSTIYLAISFFIICSQTVCPGVVYPLPAWLDLS